MPRKEKELVDPVVAFAMAHPTRVFLMSLLNGRTDSPTNLARQVGRDLKHVMYHLKVLKRLDCVELVRPRSMSGRRATSSLYTATRRPILDEADWELLAPKERVDVSTALMGLISAEVAEAMATGTFFNPDDNHISRTPFITDMEGWYEATQVLNRACEELMEVEDRISKRLATGGEAPMVARVAIIQFRFPETGLNAGRT